ncbi:hypothetical protein Pyrde_0014 [Pyrodictium delaneyi]|uniref:Uncharacterized protein n=1 Tax=Pyrodictium delaneyi TaxID=1273541 RepID=A0A0P0N0K6_9CREN|nr:hypothetical protein [Pyrodictium delaneyi]ALL00064.1 hypothetical protein Pyrde_0014 [Pyrodictium delaneyi]
MLGFGKKDCSLDSFGEDEIVEYVVANRSVREKLIERIKEDVEDALEATLVNAIRAANERPPIWWQWLFLLAAGAMAGLGLGIVIAMKTGIAGGPSLPPPPG